MGELLSRLLSLSHPSNDSSPLKLSNMEAIKKKMQAMKVEKDNACDRVDVCEEACKAARLRASKAEDEVDELMTKARQLETELDLTTEKLGIATLQLEEKEKQLSATELEMAALNRRVSQNNIRNNQNFNICNTTRRNGSTNNIKRKVKPGGSTLSRSIFAFLKNRDNTNVDSNTNTSSSRQVVCQRVSPRLSTSAPPAPCPPPPCCPSIIRIFSPHLLDTCMNEEIDK